MSSFGLSEFLNVLFGIALTAWSFTLHGLRRAVEKLGDRFDALSERLDKLATRVTVIEVKQGQHDHDDVR